MQSQRQSLLAHVLPMAAFLVLLAIGEWMPVSSDAFVLRHAEFWIYPAQAILGSVLLLWFRRCYHFAPLRKPAFTLLVAAAVFLIWTWPQRFFGASPRTGGFNPSLLVGHPVLYWLSVALRFLRLVVVVPLTEEIFWRA